MAGGERPGRELGLRERNKAEKRRRILDTAREMFSRDGFEHTSMKAIAEKAEVGFGTLFLIADSKRELLFKLFQDDIAAIRANFGEPVPAGSDVVGIFCRFLYPYIELFSRNVPLAKDYVREITFAAASAEGIGNVHFGEFFLPAAKSMLDGLKSQGRIRQNLDTAIASEALYATFMGAVRTWLRRDRPTAQNGKEYLRSIYEVVVLGIC